MRNVFFISLVILFSSWINNTSHVVEVEKIKGITMVAPPSQFDNNPLNKIQQVNANWVTLVPYAYMRTGQTSLNYNVPNQWWGEKPEGIIKCAQLAKQAGLKVMIKPQIYVPGSWIGDIQFSDSADWEKWEQSYSAYLMEYVSIAIKERIEMICIGTEIKHSVERRPQFWKALIQDIREIYSGKLVYSANWDSYDDVSFWQELDYIGISSYFPLSESTTPDQRELLRKWKPIVRKLKHFSQRKDMSILFTEFGYLTVDGCAHKAWELEKQVHHLSQNELAQANAYDALFTAYWGQSYWAGGFLWKWFPNNQGHEGYFAKDYTPQGKLAENVIKKWYSRS